MPIRQWPHGNSCTWAQNLQLILDKVWYVTIGFYHRVYILDFQDQPKCNCRQEDACLVEGNCLDKELIHQSNLKENNTSDGVNYKGFTENTFKDRFYKHRNSFKYESKANSTELSKHFWEMKRKGIEKPIMHWSVIDHAKPYKNGSKRCNLYLTEKYHIVTSPVNLINKRYQLVSKCRHENKFYLVNYKAILLDG